MEPGIRTASQPGKPVIGIVPHEAIPRYEQRIREMLARAEPYNQGEYTIDDVICGLEEQDYQMWAEIDGERIKSIAVLNLIIFPRKKVMNIMIVVSDDMSTGKAQFIKMMKEYAAINDCDSLRLTGRKGWQRELQEFGFHEPYRMLECQVKYHG